MGDEGEGEDDGDEGAEVADGAGEFGGEGGFEAEDAVVPPGGGVVEDRGGGVGWLLFLFFHGWLIGHSTQAKTTNA